MAHGARYMVYSAWHVEDGYRWPISYGWCMVHGALVHGMWFKPDGTKSMAMDVVQATTAPHGLHPASGGI